MAGGRDGSRSRRSRSGTRRSGGHRGLGPEGLRVLTLQEARQRLDQGTSFVAFDLEHSGTPSQEIVEVGAVRVIRDGEGLKEGETFHAVLAVPVRRISRFALRKTRLTREELSAGSPPADTLRSFREFLGSAVPILHAAGDDLLTLALNLRRHDLEPMPAQAADVQVWARDVFGARHLRLEDLARHFDAPVPTHRALADARATLAIFIAMLSHPDSRPDGPPRSKTDRSRA